MSTEKVKLLRAFGAEVVITPTAVPPDHPDHYLQKACHHRGDTRSGHGGPVLQPGEPGRALPDDGPEIWDRPRGA
jgi:cystathionine beta-synthase